MTTDSDSKPIQFELARHVVTALVSIETTDAGPTPTITLSSAPGTPLRTLNAAAHYVALLAELGTGFEERWAIGIEIDRADIVRVFVETVTRADDEVGRARAVLEDVVAAAQLARPVPTPSN